MGGSVYKGSLLGGRYKKDYTVFGAIYGDPTGTPAFGNPQVRSSVRTQQHKKARTARWRLDAFVAKALQPSRQSETYETRVVQTLCRADRVP